MPNLNVCQVCGLEAPTRSATLYKQTGMLIMRQTQTLSGHLCKDCISKNALSFTGWNLLLGWWGVISMIANPFYILNNVIVLGTSRGMQDVPPGATPPDLDQATVDRLSPHISKISEMFKQKKKLPEIAHEVGSLAGVRPAQVVAYVQALARAQQE